MESQEIYHLGLALIGLSIMFVAFAVPLSLAAKKRMKRQFEADYGRKNVTDGTKEVSQQKLDELPYGMPDVPKTIASLYEIKRQIGSGGGGIIYQGRHLRLDKDVVLKADKRSLSEGTLKSLKREADTLKNLSHENIPQIYDFIYEDGVVYTVMDYIEGESLDMVLERDEKFSSNRIYSVHPS